MDLTIQRLPGNPIIRPEMDARIGGNIQGPSVIRVPEWVPSRLGLYYLYFADHKGDYIRLAYADCPEGPWHIHAPGSLTLAESLFPTTPQTTESATPISRLPGVAPPNTPGIPDSENDSSHPHIASPDVHVDHDRKRIVMYYHGLESWRTQRTRVALSPDGVKFSARRELLGPSYCRWFKFEGMHYAMAMPGILFRSTDGLSNFERGPTLFEPLQRHSAVLVRGDDLFVFWTRVTDAPERIFVSRVSMKGDWNDWRAGPETEVMRPEEELEGADRPVEPSWRSAVLERVNQLRDPCIFQDSDRLYLYYAVAGESGIAVARVSGLE